MTRVLDPTNPASRRHFLRGLGASIALPAFASLASPLRLFAGEAPALATTATGAPLRAAFVYFPNGRHPGVVSTCRAGQGRISSSSADSRGPWLR